MAAEVGRLPSGLPYPAKRRHSKAGGREGGRREGGNAAGKRSVGETGTRVAIWAATMALDFGGVSSAGGRRGRQTVGG